MARNRWRLCLLIVLVVLTSALVLHWVNVGPVGRQQGDGLYSQTGDAVAYFPALSGAVYHFVGEGMEYADFTRQITYTAPGLLQVEDASGTNLAQIIQCTTEEVKVVWSQEEFYEEKNLLTNFTEGDLDLILIKTPLKIGNTWQDSRFKREVVATGKQVTVPLGTFFDVIVIKSVAFNFEGYVQYDYYAKNIGLIKRETSSTTGDADGFIVSALKQLNTYL